MSARDLTQSGRDLRTLVGRPGFFAPEPFSRYDHGYARLWGEGAA